MHQESAPEKKTPILESLTKDRPKPKDRRLPRRTRAKTSLKTNDKVAPITEPQSPVIHKDAVNPSVVQSTPVSITETKVQPTSTASVLEQTKASTSVEAQNQLTAKDLQDAIFKAVQDYTQYHTDGNKGNVALNRGQGDGFFSFLRHGAKGLATANALYNSINSENISIHEAVNTLKDFLSDSSRAYHHHSFTSYLADALAQKGLVTAHKTARYNQNEVVKEMEQWISDNSTSQHNKTL